MFFKLNVVCLKDQMLSKIFVLLYHECTICVCIFISLVFLEHTYAYTST